MTMNTAGIKYLPVIDDDRYRGFVPLRSLAPFLTRARLDVT